MNYANYIITHKEFTPPKKSCFIPLQVGFANKIYDCRDNTGDNISEKNQNYCELTGVYWIWKNDIHSDYIGISHYRRYFTKSKLSYSKFFFLNDKDVNIIFKDYDVILANEAVCNNNLIMQYCENSGYLSDLNILRDAIKLHYPEYVDIYDSVMSGTKFSPYNMLIMKKEDYNQYCEWLFNILFEVEKHTDISQYDNYKKRIYGFMSERLLNVWVQKQQYKIKHCRVVNPDLTYKQKIEELLFRIKYKLGL